MSESLSSPLTLSHFPPDVIPSMRHTCNSSFAHQHSDDEDIDIDGGGNGSEDESHTDV